MRFNVRYIPKGGGQPTQAVVNGADERTVGWAFVQRGDQLLSVEPADRARTATGAPSPALIRAAAPSTQRPPQPASPAIVYSVVAILIVVGIGVPASNLEWFYESHASVTTSAAELNRMEGKVAESKQMGLYRPSYDKTYLKPRRDSLAAASLERRQPIAWCLFGVALLGVALTITCHHRIASRRWADWNRG